MGIGNVCVAVMNQSAERELLIEMTISTLLQEGCNLDYLL
jgi:hypothetical protein